MLRGDGGERPAKRHLAPKCGLVRKLVEFVPVELNGLVAMGWTIAHILRIPDEDLYHLWTVIWPGLKF